MVLGCGLAVAILRQLGERTFAVGGGPRSRVSNTPALRDGSKPEGPSRLDRAEKPEAGRHPARSNAPVRQRRCLISVWSIWWAIHGGGFMVHSFSKSVPYPPAGPPKTLRIELLLMFRPSPALQRSGSRFTRARSSEKFFNVCGQSLCKTFKNGNSRVLEPSLKATDVSPIDPGVDC